MALQLPLQTAPFFTQIGPAHRLTPKYVIIEPWNGLGWDRPLKAIQSSPPAVSGGITVLMLHFMPEQEETNYMRE